MDKLNLKSNIFRFVTCAVLLIVLGGVIYFYYMSSSRIISYTAYQPDKSMVDQIVQIRENKDITKPLFEIYKNIPVIDVHSHDAGYVSLYIRDKFGIDKTVLFGNVSEPSAKKTDHQAWADYINEPNRIYPSFAGISVNEDEGIQYTKEKLEKGYLNIGELYAASAYSPLKWKAKNPISGNLPEIYDIASKYKVPVLLHIDPPTGAPIAHFKRAMNEHPETIFIFGHANAYNSPGNIELLLEQHDNLYIDFFAGFTKYNKGSKNTIEDFIPLIERYPDRFLLGTDSGYGVGYENAIIALYEVLDKLTPSTAVKVAYQNYEQIIELQPLTKTQVAKLKELLNDLGENGTYRLNKRMANELIFELQKKLLVKGNKDS